MSKPKSVEEGVQVKFLLDKQKKLEFQTRCKLTGTTMVEELGKMVDRFLKGEGMDLESQRKLEKAKLQEIRRVAELVQYAIAWPVGKVREIFADDLENEGLHPNVSWVDEVGNWFDEEMNLLTKEGEVDNRVGGGTLNWELTWLPAIQSGWTPSNESLSDVIVEQRYKHVVARIK